MLIGFICDNSNVLSVIRIVKIVITIIQIAVPIVFILTIMLTLVGDITNNKEPLSGIKSKIVPSTIAVIAIVLVPFLVRLIFNIASTDTSDYTKCIENATTENIEIAIENEAENLLQIAMEKETLEKYTEALNATKKIKNTEIRDDFIEKLTALKELIDFKEEVETSVNNVNRENYKEVLEMVNSLPDGEFKDKMIKSLESLKSKFAPKYPANPNDPIYAGLSSLNGKSIVSVLNANGSSVEELNANIKSAVESAGVGTREATTAAATTLIGTLASYKYRINYEWWGKYEAIGIDSRWGNVLSSSQYSRDCNNYASRHDGDGSNCWENMQWYGLDCSGFAKWIVIQAFQNTGVTYEGGAHKSLNGNSAVCQVGDPIRRPGHVAIIIAIDNESKQYIIAESSSGVALNSVGFGDNNWYCEHITIYND